MLHDVAQECAAEIRTLLAREKEIDALGQELNTLSSVSALPVAQLSLEPPRESLERVVWKDLKCELRKAFAEEQQHLAWEKQKRDEDQAEKDAFHSVFKMNRDELLPYLTQGLPGKYKLETHGVSRHGIADQVDIWLKDDGGRQVAHLWVFTKDKNFGIERLDAPVKGCGMGKVLMKNVFSLCDKMGMKTAETYAGDSDGPKFWLRFFGIHPQGEVVGADFYGRGGDFYHSQNSFRDFLDRRVTWMERENRPDVAERLGSALAIQDDGSMLDALYHAPEKVGGQTLWQFVLDGQHVHSLHHFDNAAEEFRRHAFLDDAAVDMDKYCRLKDIGYSATAANAGVRHALY